MVNNKDKNFSVCEKMQLFYYYSISDLYEY